MFLLHRGLHSCLQEFQSEFVGIVSGYTQGRAAAAGMQLISKKDGALGNAIIYAVMVETYAILAFIISFLMYNGVQIG